MPFAAIAASQASSVFISDCAPGWALFRMLECSGRPRAGGYPSVIAAMISLLFSAMSSG
jgi:hypothetical protein